MSLLSGAMLNIDAEKKLNKAVISRSIRDALVDGESVLLKVNGNSMLPVLKPGDRVKLQTANAYYPGDLIAYYSPNLDFEIVHRFVGKFRWRKDLRYSLIADNGGRADPLVSNSDILGRVVSINNTNYSTPVLVRIKCRIVFLSWLCQAILGKIFAVRTKHKNDVCPDR